MVITATELKMHLGKYLEAAKTEDIYIEKNGRQIAKLTNLDKERQELLESVLGCVKIDPEAVGQTRYDKLMGGKHDKELIAEARFERHLNRAKQHSGKTEEEE